MKQDASFTVADDIVGESAQAIASIGVTAGIRVNSGSNRHRVKKPGL